MGQDKRRMRSAGKGRLQCEFFRLVFITVFFVPLVWQVVACVDKETAEPIETA